MLFDSISSLSHIIEILGTAAFAISGVFAAMEKKLDIFGLLVIAFVTAIGGGTIRDILIGATPVAWMRDTSTLTVISVSVIAAILLKGKSENFQRTLIFFDALGLGLFTVIGLRKGIAAHLSPGVCIVLGTITACFGGVLRDVLLNRVPVIFQKEVIYATTCIIGGIGYFLLRPVLTDAPLDIISALLVFSVRMIAYKKKWRLPVV
ncbi:trimeric intracellular cation channel family protein [Mucilaginibacter sp. RS28]|uniref:Trimeric intracellular cation channel family protein n=1 Tax=Mucilaginibacter straminoryzae TaxID=2932774 RepID=A0A9X1X784_9SPHI|nr:trimeric intracellular cation channel family protein [Mucilaginibacter straminoryzae]MCJ8211700.1 trimeric intracellular cation channel family protein [Mucilaginibacter straminoryzae]